MFRVIAWTIYKPEPDFEAESDLVKHEYPDGDPQYWLKYKKGSFMYPCKRIALDTPKNRETIKQTHAKYLEVSERLQKEINLVYKEATVLLDIENQFSDI